MKTPYTNQHLWVALIITALFVLSVVTTYMRWYTSDSEFVQQDIYKTPEHLTNRFIAYSEIEMLRNLSYFAGSEGNFDGTITQEKLHNGDIQVIIRDKYVPDDSVGIREQRFVATKQNDKLVVIQYFKRHSCHRYPHIWQEMLTIFINPLWTKESCR